MARRKTDDTNETHDTGAASEPRRKALSEGPRPRRAGKLYLGKYPAKSPETEPEPGPEAATEEE